VHRKLNKERMKGLGAEETRRTDTKEYIFFILSHSSHSFFVFSMKILIVKVLPLVPFSNYHHIIKRGHIREIKHK